MKLLFDYVSPYAYLAVTQIRALAAKHGRSVEPVPVLFAGLLQANGARGPAEIPPKREHMYRDLDRLAAAYGVPIAPPASHPFNPLAALRLTLAVEDPQARWPLVERLFRATWVDARPVHDAAEVARIATEAGLDGDALTARATSDEVKSLLRRTTDDAIAAGVFGVPTVVVDDELFWGVDSLWLLDRHLGGAKVDPRRMELWRALAPSAVRR